VVDVVDRMDKMDLTGSKYDLPLGVVMRARPRCNRDQRGEGARNKGADAQFGDFAPAFGNHPGQRAQRMPKLPGLAKPHRAYVAMVTEPD